MKMGPLEQYKRKKMLLDTDSMQQTSCGESDSALLINNCKL